MSTPGTCGRSAPASDSIERARAKRYSRKPRERTVAAESRFHGDMRVLLVKLFVLGALTAGSATVVMAQQPEPTTRDGAIAKEQADKVPTLHPHVVSKTERLIAKASSVLSGNAVKWHPFFES